jgi:hypothetical protein
MDNSGIVNYALGKSESSPTFDDATVVVRLNRKRDQEFRKLTGTLGMSVEYTLNVATRYAIHVASARGVAVADLPEYPRRAMRGQRYSLEVTLLTEDALRGAGLTLDGADRVAACGIALMYRKLIEETSR